MKNEGVYNSLKMKKIAEKLSEMTNKFPIEKKKAKLRNYKEEYF